MVDEDKKKKSVQESEGRPEEMQVEKEVEEDEQHENPRTEEVKQLHVELGLTSDDQREIGRQCKRLLDHGRLSYLRHHGYQCQLVRYISDDVTPENIALLVTRDSST